MELVAPGIERSDLDRRALLAGDDFLDVEIVAVEFFRCCVLVGDAGDLLTSWDGDLRGLEAMILDGNGHVIAGLSHGHDSAKSDGNEDDHDQLDACSLVHF